LNPKECAERIRLTDEYSQRITDYGVQLEALKAPAGERNATDWRSTETALAESQKAWEALERHTREHRCLALNSERRDPADTGDQRRLVDSLRECSESGDRLEEEKNNPLFD
jgi:hypothetical protein